MHSMSDFVMSVSYEGVLMENLKIYMQQGVAMLSTIGAPCNIDLHMVDECAITPLRASPPISCQL